MRTLFRWAREAPGQYDTIIVDFPDPTEFSLGKLYTESFYSRVGAPAGAGRHADRAEHIATDRTALLLDGRNDARGSRAPLRGYHVYVPSFGEWGFTLAGHRPVSDNVTLPTGLRFLRLPPSGRCSISHPTWRVAPLR